MLSFVLPCTLGALIELPYPAEEMIPTGPVGGPFAYWFTYVFPAFRVLEFMAGVAAALLVRRHARGRDFPSVRDPDRRPGGGGSARRLVPAAFPRMLFLGEISYRLYVFQLLLLAVVAGGLRPALAAAGVLVDKEAALPHGLLVPVVGACLAFCSLVAWAAYHRVEVPMMRRLRPRTTGPTAGRTPA